MAHIPGPIKAVSQDNECSALENHDWPDISPLAEFRFRYNLERINAPPSTELPDQVSSRKLHVGNRSRRMRKKHLVSLPSYDRIDSEIETREGAHTDVRQRYI